MFFYSIKPGFPKVSHYFLLTCIGLALSCQSKAVKHEGEIVTTDTAPSVSPSKPLSVIGTENQIPLDSINLPDEEKSLCKILTSGGVFHDGEVYENAKDLDWMGLFKKGNQYYLQATKVSTRRVKDEIVDEDNEISGWEINPDVKDDCSLLINGLSNLQESPIDTFAISKKIIWPEEQIKLKINGIIYILSATGKITHTSDDWKDVINYKLYLSCVKDGKVIKQLISAKPQFNDHMISILWIGDLDQDSKPDFIIDTSDHYNVQSTSLFLSSKAGKGELVKFVGSHSISGC